HNIAARAKSPPLGAKSPPLGAKSPPLRPKTEVGKFQGIELTSIINMMDVENREGSRPLVDLDAEPRQRSRQGFDSDPGLQSLVRSLPPAVRGPTAADPTPPPPSMSPMPRGYSP